MSKKHLIAIVGIAVGVSTAMAVGHWPHYAAAIEMTMYTLFVFLPLFTNLWSERHRPKFWIGMSLATIAHGVFLYIIRSSFPFQSVWIVVPIIFAEAIAIFVVLDKLLGERSVECRN